MLILTTLEEYISGLANAAFPTHPSRQVISLRPPAFVRAGIDYCNSLLAELPDHVLHQF